MSAIDFVGAFLALAGSTLLVVRISLLACVLVLTDTACPDLGGRRIRLELHSCHRNARSGLCGFSVLRPLAMEGHGCTLDTLWVSSISTRMLAAD